MGRTVKPFKVNVVVKAHGLSAAADSMHSGRIPEETEMFLACYFARAAIVAAQSTGLLTVHLVLLHTYCNYLLPYAKLIFPTREVK